MIPRASVVPSTGRLRTVAFASLAAPTSAQAGFRLDANQAVVIVTTAAAIAPLSREGAYSFDANGALVTVDNAAKVAPVSYSAGFPFDANGSMVTSAGAITSVQDALGFDVNGNVCI